ncbi:Nramp family metal ion transporter [Streptococcus pneumoniae]|nr:Nramp family metal ion transporter [Streptococcus pneumoniae]
MSQAISLNQSTWASKLKAMGPGILMATAAVGGSHIVSSTQAGGSYGWSLLLLVILANVFKYPFFRFGAEYTADTGKTLVEGYAEKGKLYLWIFFILNVFSAMVNTAGVAILCSAIIASAFPMIGSFLTTPFFALLNYALVTRENKNLPSWLKHLAIAGLIFLFGFAIFFIYALAIGKAG